MGCSWSWLRFWCPAAPPLDPGPHDRVRQRLSAAAAGTTTITHEEMLDMIKREREEERVRHQPFNDRVHAFVAEHQTADDFHVGAMFSCTFPDQPPRIAVKRKQRTVTLARTDAVVALLRGAFPGIEVLILENL